MNNESISTKRLAVKIFVGGIEMGDLIINEGETFDIVPIDCFLGVQKSCVMGEQNGMASDGICIRTYKNEEDVFSEFVQPTEQKSLHNTEQLVQPAEQNQLSVVSCPTTAQGHKDAESPANTEFFRSLHPDVQSLIASGKMKVGTKDIEKASPPLSLSPHTPLSLSSPLSSKSLKDSIPLNMTDEKLTAVGKKKPRKRAGQPAEGRPVPEEFISVSSGGQIPKGVISYARKILGNDLTESAVRIMLENFVDYHLKLGKEWFDWMAVWRNWVRNAKRFQERDGSSMKSGAPQMIDDDNRFELLRD
jgi:hypothetical protein